MIVVTFAGVTFTYSIIFISNIGYTIVERCLSKVATTSKVHWVLMISHLLSTVCPLKFPGDKKHPYARKSVSEF